MSSPTASRKRFAFCRHHSRKILSLIAGILLPLSPAVAQEPQPPVHIAPKTPSAQQSGAQTPPANPPSAHTLDSEDLLAFFDGIIPLQLERADIGGASVLVMQNDKVLLQKGYGFADAKEKKPVDPASTIFRLTGPHAAHSPYAQITRVAASTHFMASHVGLSQKGRLADLAVSLPLGLGIYYGLSRLMKVQDLDASIRAITCDPDRLQQVVWNLLSNAIKFTPACGRVELRLERAGTAVAIVVHDNGVGISPDFLPHVFDRFRQEDTGSRRRFGGLGLGLAIVKHLVELHGGSVTADSEGQDRGATFTVRVPAPAR